MAEHFTEADGHQLAADMLRELRVHYLAREEGVTTDAEIEALWHRDDSAILRRYLSTVRRRRSPALEKGFLAVLTDQLGAAQDGAIDPDFYEEAGHHG